MLGELGLTRIEEEIYIALLRLGSTTAWPLIKESGKHKSTVYNTLQRLIDKGLVSYVSKEGIKYYQALDPDLLKDIVDEKILALEETRKNLSPAVEKLKAMQNVEQPTENVQLFYGKRALKIPLDKMIEVGKEIYLLSSAAMFDREIPAYSKKWHAEREKRGIRVHAIYSGALKEYRTKKPLKFSYVHYLKEHYESRVSTAIFGDYVIQVFWIEKPFGILIHDKELAKTYMELWKILRKTCE